MNKGFVALALEVILFFSFTSLWYPMFEEQRFQERCESILNSLTKEKCEQSLIAYLETCQSLKKSVVNSVRIENKEYDLSTATCDIKGEIEFVYGNKTRTGSFNAQAIADTTTPADTIDNVSINSITLRDHKNTLSLKFNSSGNIVVEKLKIGETINIDGVRCVFERKWDSGEWHMKTSKVLTPTQMYRVYENPKCKNPDGIRFSTESLLLYGAAVSGQVLATKENGVVHRYAAQMVDDKVKLTRIE